MSVNSHICIRLPAWPVMMKLTDDDDDDGDFGHHSSSFFFVLNTFRFELTRGCMRDAKLEWAKLVVASLVFELDLEKQNRKIWI